MEFVTVINYPNYRLYTDGRVFSLYRNKFLKPSVQECGYTLVGLSNKGRASTKCLHNLLALHFIPNPDGHPEVTHINGIKDDNRLENLKWGSVMENRQNKCKYKSNTSGIRCITSVKRDNSWSYHKKYYTNITRYYSKSKIDCICFKYIHILKIRVQKRKSKP